MGHAGADVGQDLHDVVFDVGAWEGAQELEELRADVVACVEEEWEQRREHHAHWLREWGVHGSRCDGCS